MADAEPQTQEQAAPKAKPASVGWLIALYATTVITAGVVGFSVAVAYASFVKGCLMLGVG